MYIAFTLSMPGVNSWNGRWSGAEKKYVIVRAFGNSDKAQARVAELLKTTYHHYNFGDGWRAGVSIKLVDGREARKLRRESAGFCGYDWMVDEILTHGRILTLAERTKKHPAERRAGRWTTRAESSRAS